MNGAPANPISGISPSAATSSVDGLGDRSDLRRLERLDRRDVGRGADRVGDDGSDVGHDVQVDARRAQRHHDVGEQDRGVDAVAAHRLQA